MYYVDNGAYPSIGSDNIGYDFSVLAPMLVPKYMAKLPTDPSGGAYQYVRGSIAQGSYGIRIVYEAKTSCHIGTNNGSIGWWGVSAC